MKKRTSNPISQTNFAKLKKVTRQRVRHWIKNGHIITIDVNGTNMIDLNVYNDFEPDTIKNGRPVTEKGLLVKNEKLERRLQKLETSKENTNA